MNEPTAPPRNRPRGEITTFEDAMSAVRALRQENAQRREQLKEYKALFEGIDDAGQKWIKETFRLMRENPLEAGDRWAKLSLSYLGEDGFRDWVESTLKIPMNDTQTQTNTTLSTDKDNTDMSNGNAANTSAGNSGNGVGVGVGGGGLTPMGSESQGPQSFGGDVPITRAEFQQGLRDFATQLTEALGASQQQNEQAMFLADAKALGYAQDTWQFGVLVDAAVETNGDLNAAHALVQQRLGANAPGPQQTTQLVVAPAGSAQEGVEVFSEPLTPSGPPVGVSTGVVDPPVAKATTLKEAGQLAREYFDSIDRAET